MARTFDRIVGLLTDGLTVKSNDVFTPHEPGFGQASQLSNIARIRLSPAGKAIAGRMTISTKRRAAKSRTWSWSASFD